MTERIENKNQSKKNRKAFAGTTLAFLLFSAFFILLFTSCQNKNRAAGLEPQEEHSQATSEINLSPEAIKSAGIELQELKPVKLRPQLKVPGEIKFNPKLYYRLTSRVAGRVEQLLVFEGDRVKQGQCLAKLFSLPYLEALTELRLAYERWQRLDQLRREEKQAAWSILESARAKLKLLGLNDREIDDLLGQPAADQLYCLKAPISGQVISRQVLNGDQVEAGAVLLEIASTETLWVEIFIQEKDLSRISPGAQALVRVQAYPGMEFKGQLRYLGPTVEESTRLVKGRLELENQSGLLKPGMYAEVFLPAQEMTELAVPDEAVQELSGQKVIFVSEDGRKFNVRPVRVGEEIDGWRPVLQGLSLGEKYVSRGAFIIKSELLKATFEEDEHHHD